MPKADVVVGLPKADVVVVGLPKVDVVVAFPNVDDVFVFPKADVPPKALMLLLELGPAWFALNRSA